MINSIKTLFLFIKFIFISFKNRKYYYYIFKKKKEEEEIIEGLFKNPINKIDLNKEITVCALNNKVLDCD